MTAETGGPETAAAPVNSRLGIADSGRGLVVDPRALMSPTSLLDAVINLDVVKRLHPRDSMLPPNGTSQHYHSVGRGALVNIISAMSSRLSYSSGEAPIRSLLDFGCGYGRVARYLRAAFPDAQLDVTDYDHEGVAWCVEAFGASDVAGNITEDQYDLIWVGSVFTHLPEAIFSTLIRSLKRGLRRDGILIFTTHGAQPAFHLDHFARGDTDRQYMSYGLSRESAAAIVAGYHATGYGYQDYKGQHDYGVAVGTPAWYIARTTDSTTLLLHAQEQGWDVHQDVLAFLKVEDVANLKRGRLFTDWTDI